MNKLADVIEAMYLHLAILHMTFSVILLAADERKQAARCMAVLVRIVETFRELVTDDEYEAVRKVAKEMLGEDAERVLDEMPKDLEDIYCPAVDAIVNGALLGALRLR